MNDLKLLHDAWETPEAPTHTAYTQARAALLERGRAPAPRPRARPPRLTVRRASLAALALVTAAGVGLAQNLGGTGRDGRPGSVLPGLPAVPNASAAEVLQRAATAAQEQPFTAPREDQWIYAEDRLTSSDDDETQTSRVWHRADGRAIAHARAGRALEVETIRPRKRGRPLPPGPFDGYRAAAALPTDPDTLLRWAYDHTDAITGAGSTDDAEVYAVFRGILRGNGVLPPDVESAIFSAMKRIPGVTLDTADVLGRPTFALALTDEWLRQEILLDRDTYAYAGQRSTTLKDAVLGPEKAGNATGKVRKGYTVLAERTAAGIVDEPGLRP